MDIGEYEPFLAMGFSTPPVDQDIPPTFGTLLSCVSVCMRLLTKVRLSPFLAMGFSTPPVDQDIPPTFGTLLSCVSVCMRLLTKVRNSYNVIFQQACDAHMYINSCVVSI